MDRELLQDSDGVNESFWDGLGVEFEAKYIFDFRSAPRGPGSARDGGHGGSPGRGATRGPRDGVPINSCPSVPGRLNFGGEVGGEIGSEIGSEIGGVGYGVFFAPGSRSRDQKTPPKTPLSDTSTFTCRIPISRRGVLIGARTIQSILRIFAARLHETNEML